jgi:hypothetical protein
MIKVFVNIRNGLDAPGLAYVAGKVRIRRRITEVELDTNTIGG